MSQKVEINAENAAHTIPPDGREAPGAQKNAPVEYFNRHTGRVEREQIYGEAPLRWAYETPAGRAAVWLLARRAFFSRWFGWRMRRPASVARIAPFIADFGLDPAEFAEAPENFRSFDDFFSRKLVPRARPVDDAPGVAVFPADGRHLGFQNISAATGVYAKGQRFSLAEFLGDTALAGRYQGGALVCSRLCPVDYHRFHFPVDAIPAAPRDIKGWLYSVNPVALRRNIARLWENKRAVVTLDAGGRAGVVTLVIVGATNVGSWRYTHTPGVPVRKGGEAGYFRFGGSFVATLFEPGRVRLADDLLRETASGRELYAHVGTSLGELMP
ncbi:MAG: phosphatidylserine decarboxylase [Puniceicoccales bacterium]|nr:phosphatidylserine decarboxylase [Puniceicoccales bacterium]